MTDELGQKISDTVILTAAIGVGLTIGVVFFIQWLEQKRFKKHFGALKVEGPKHYNKSMEANCHRGMDSGKEIYRYRDLEKSMVQKART